MPWEYPPTPRLSQRGRRLERRDIAGPFMVEVGVPKAALGMFASRRERARARFLLVFRCFETLSLLLPAAFWPDLRDHVYSRLGSWFLQALHAKLFPCWSRGSEGGVRHVCFQAGKGPGAIPAGVSLFWDVVSAAACRLLTGPARPCI